MLTPIRQNSYLYNTTSEIQKNAVLNRGFIESMGVEVPFALMANNKDERIERLMRAVWFVFASFVAPVIFMPRINKHVLKNSKIAENAGETLILRVSKKYLTKNADYMLEGFKKTAEELEKNPKFKDASIHFNNVLKNFPDKEKLRENLIKAHQHIFSLEFALSSLLAISNPWVINYITEKRTKRNGYVGEFKMADKEYTDKNAVNHEKTKKIKMALSFLFPILPAIIIPKIASKAILKPIGKLGTIGKFLKNNAHIFDYKDAVYASKAACFGIMAFGDFPSYMLACRDKHELKLRSTGFSFIIAMLFAGDFILNNIVGRISDNIFKTKLMNREGFENTGFLKNFLMHVNSFEKLNAMPHLSKVNKRAALAMYWGNFALTTALLGFGLPFILNKGLKKDVAKDQKNISKDTTKP